MSYKRIRKRKIENKPKFMYWMLFIFALVFAFIGIVFFQEYYITKDYVERDGYIDELKSNTYYNRGKKTEYNYTIHWYVEGKEYEHRVYHELSKPDLLTQKVWASPDNKGACANKSDYLVDVAVVLLEIAGVLFVLALFFRFIYFKIHPNELYRNMSTSKKRKYREDVRLGLICYGCFGIISSIVMLIGIFLEPNLSSVQIYDIDGEIFFVVSTIGAFITAGIINKSLK